MTTATSNPSEEQQIDTSVGCAKRLLMRAWDQYNEAVKDGAQHRASWWDGYIRGIQHILESQHE